MWVDTIAVDGGGGGGGGIDDACASGAVYDDAKAALTIDTAIGTPLDAAGEGEATCGDEGVLLNAVVVTDARLEDVAGAEVRCVLVECGTAGDVNGTPELSVGPDCVGPD